MAIHARLAAPPPAPRQNWPWHQAKVASIPAHLLWRGDRRMEAENYLSSGHGLRLAIQSRAVGWKPLHQFARVWQPSRLKGIQVNPAFGTPFLAATQVFDIRPIPRKWLALDRTEDAANRFVEPGTILVTCSGAVGRATLANATHERTLISHDLLRIAPEDEAQSGWLYAYLLSSQAHAMMTGAKYGHIIKHLETSHLNVLPVPVVEERYAREFREQSAVILDFRNRAQHLSLKAEERFAQSLGPLNVKEWGEIGYRIRAKAFSSGRRRFEGTFHNPGAASVQKHLERNNRRFIRLRDAGFDLWLPTRFRRIPAADGVELIESSAVFEINPNFEKKVAEVDFGDEYQGRVKAGWLLVARSGQTYGLNGNVAFATKAHESRVVSDDLIRIAPKAEAVLRTGYLFTVLSHPIYGRPLVKALPYGSSIPHIDVADLKEFRIVRLDKIEEDAIADLAEESARLRAHADVLERSMSDEAGRLIEQFVAGDMLPFVTTMSATATSPASSPSPRVLPEHARVRLRRALPAAGLTAGASGTIVHVYEDGAGYEVEFTEGRKHPAVETLFPADIEELTEKDE